MLGVYDVGIYSTAVNIVDILAVISSSIGTLLLPRAAEMKDRMEKYYFTRGVIIAIAISLSVVAIIAELLAGFIIPIIYGQNYVASVTPFRILVPGMVFWGIEGIIGNYFSAENKFSYSLITMTIALILNIVFNILLIPLHGINGAAIASTFSYFLACFVQLVFLRRFRKSISVYKDIP